MSNSNELKPHERLELAVAEWSGVPHAVACNSGTAALHLALEALKLQPDSKILVPDFAMVACSRAVTLAGHRPIFVDCDETLNIDVNAVEYACHIERDIRAVLAVHTYGRRCNMNKIIELANQHDLFVVEDMAEAHGVMPHNGSDAACWSFYKNKIIGGEEGGAVAFRLEKPAALAKQLRSQGFTEAHDFNHVPRGHNYRLADSLADRIWPQIAYCQSFLKLRRMVACWYDQTIWDVWKMPKHDVVWVYDLRIPGITGTTQNALVSALQREGIQARHAFKPLSKQEEYSGSPIRLYHSKRYVTESNSDIYSREVIYLPAHPSVTVSQVNRAAEIIEIVICGGA